MIGIKIPFLVMFITLSGTLEFETKMAQLLSLNPVMCLLAQDNSGTGHKWRLMDDEPWRRAYVFTKEDAGIMF